MWWHHTRGMTILEELISEKSEPVSFGKQAGLFSTLRSPLFDTDGLNKCVQGLNNMNEMIKTELYR